MLSARSVSAIFLGCLALTASPCLMETVRADVIRLHNGGEVRGEILGSQASEAVTSIETLSGTRILIARDEIEFVERRTPLFEEYVTRSRTIPHTTAAHWELAEWCRTQRLLEEREQQLEQLLDVDPDHEEARKILGYVRHFGHWITKEDEMLQRGYIRYKGRWVTRQELALKTANADQQAAELAWVPKVRIWMIWLTGNDSQRAANGLGELRKIRDPDAISALTKLLAQHDSQDIRLLFVEIISQMDGPRPVPALVERIVFDASHFVRQSALRALTPQRYSAAVPLLVAFLRHRMNPVVCHAAEALAEIGDERAVPPLIDALITNHEVAVQVPDQQRMNFSSGGYNTGPFSGVVPPGVEIAARTGQLPYGFTMQQSGTPIPMKTVTVTQSFKNVPVLNALEKMTGGNLGFNERDWHLWWALQKG